MMDNQPFSRLTQEAYNILLGLAKERPELWLDPHTDFADELGGEEGIYTTAENARLSSQICLEVDDQLKAKQTGRWRSDIQAYEFWQSLQGMTPTLASDPLMWAWASHFWCHQFVLDRFPPAKIHHESQEKMTDWVISHWFYESNKRPHSMNIPARLWWIAHLSHRASQSSQGAFTTEEAVKHFSEHPQQFHTIFYYPALWEDAVLAEFVRLLMNEAAGAKKSGYETIARRINLASGTRLLGTVPQSELRSMFIDIADMVLSDPNKVADRKYVRNPKTMRVLSLGAGVQSSVLALMCDRGEYDLDKPDFAVFADTGWEPPEIYHHLDWLKEQLSYEVVTVSAGNLQEDILSGSNASGEYTFLGIPCYVVNPDGTNSVLKRQCTSDYKLKPIYQEIRSRLGLNKGQRAPKNVRVEMWLGISSDESERMKPGLYEYVVNKYPLIDLGFSRAQLVRWFTDNYPGRSLQRSACIGCPYHSNKVWAEMKESSPYQFAHAVNIDRALRSGQAASKVRGTAYLHRSRTPLENADLSVPAKSGFTEECEGMCGI